MVNKRAVADHSRTTPGQWVPDEGFCYFWGSPSRSIKIGATAHLNARLRALRYQFGLPCISFLAVVVGGSKVEAHYHEQFATHRVRGEWFNPHPDILAEIERLQAHV